MPQCVRPLPSVLFLALSVLVKFVLENRVIHWRIHFFQHFFLGWYFSVYRRHRARIIRNGFSLDKCHSSLLKNLKQTEYAFYFFWIADQTLT